MKIDRRGSNDLTEVVKKEVERITDNKSLHNRLIPQRVHNTDDVKWEFKCAMARRCGCEVRTRGVLSGDILDVYSWQVHNDHVQPMNKRGMTTEQREFLAKKIVDKVPPLLAHRALGKETYGRNITYEQVRYFYANNKTKIEANTFSNTKASWETWAKDKPWRVDAPGDEPLVLYHDFSEGSFRVLITTNRMLLTV